MFSFPILTLADFFFEISRSSRNRGVENYYVIFSSVFAAFAILWLVLYTLEKNKNGNKIIKKVKLPLFTQLCRAHNLSSAQSELLKTMTVRAGLQPPAVIFIDPTLWPHCIEKSVNNRQQLLELMTQLFGADRVAQWFPSTPEVAIAQEQTPAGLA
ncbi:MAG: hypothetical protein JKY95_17530 [Planctomycetaceae bacterium]|nr:hypothetical protein [Planctomycetaceae bacterium]